MHIKMKKKNYLDWTGYVRTLDAALIIIDDFTRRISGHHHSRFVAIAQQQTAQQRGHFETVSPAAAQQSIWRQKAAGLQRKKKVENFFLL